MIMNKFFDFLRNKLGPGFTPGFNPNEELPAMGGMGDGGALNVGKKTNPLSGFFKKLGIGGGGDDGAAPLVNANAPRAPMDAVDGRANLQANVPEGLASSATRPRIAPEDDTRRSKPEPAYRPRIVGGPNDYTNDPEGRDFDQYRVNRSLKEKKWHDFIKPALAGALLGAQSASRDPNAGGWDILGAAGAGAAAGGIADKVNPAAGSRVMYEAFRAPEFRAQRERQQVEEGRQFERQRQDAELGRVRTAADLNVARQRSGEERKQLDRQKFYHALKQAQEAAAQRDADRQYQHDQDTLKQSNWEREFSAKDKPPKPSAPSYNEITDEEEAKMIENEGPIAAIVESSLAGRREMLLQKLSPKHRDILTRGKYQGKAAKRDANNNEIKDKLGNPVYEPADIDAEDEDVKEARAAWDKIEGDERARITDETKEKRKAKVAAEAARRRASGSQGLPTKTAGTGLSRNLKDVIGFIK